MVFEKKLFVILLAIILLINIHFLSAIDDLISLQGNVRQNGLELSSGNITVTIYDSLTGGSIIYNSSDDFNNVISGGEYDIVMGNGSQILTLEYGRIYYMELYINNEKVVYKDGSTRQIFQSSVGQINASYINPQQINQTHLAYSINISNATGYLTGNLAGNLTLFQITGGEKIAFVNQSNIFTQSQTIQGNLSITGNISVSGNITADTGFFKLAWSYITNLPNILFGLDSENNNNNLLVLNLSSTGIGYNESVLNNTIYNRITYYGLIQNLSYLSTYNATYAAWAYNQTNDTFTLWNSTWDNRLLIIQTNDSMKNYVSSIITGNNLSWLST